MAPSRILGYFLYVLLYDKFSTREILRQGIFYIYIRFIVDYPLGKRMLYIALPCFSDMATLQFSSLP